MIDEENSFSEISSILFDVPQGSILGPSLFLICVIDMSMEVKFNVILYLDDKCIVFDISNVKRSIKKQLNQDFENICDWLDIHFGDDLQIKQYYRVT